MPKTKDQCFGVAARLYCDDEFSDVEVDMDVVHRVTDILHATANDQPLPTEQIVATETLKARTNWPSAVSATACCILVIVVTLVNLPKLIAIFQSL